MKKNDSTNFVLHAKSDQFYWEGIGQLSIKTFSNGKIHYKTDKGFFAVKQHVGVSPKKYRKKVILNKKY
jgi:AraC family transcriptional regulator